MRKLTIFALALTAIAGTAMAQSADVQIIHNSPDPAADQHSAQKVGPDRAKAQPVVEMGLLPPRDGKGSEQPDRGNVDILHHAEAIAKPAALRERGCRDKKPPEPATRRLHLHAAENFILRDPGDHHATFDALDVKSVTAHAEFPFGVRQGLLTLGYQKVA